MRVIFAMLISCWYLSVSYSQDVSLDQFKYNKKASIEKKEVINQFVTSPVKKAPERMVIVKDQLGYNNYDYLKKGLAGVKFHLSTSFYGDTTSVSFNGEYLDIRPAEINNESLPFSYIRSDFVTNQEWSEFNNYVCDSIVRRILGEEFPAEFLLPTYDENNKEKFQHNWDINFKENLTYSDPEYSPLIAEIYYPESERFYQKKEIDVRKSVYENINGERHYLISLFRDSALWINNTDIKTIGNLEDAIVKLYNNDSYFSDFPVCGINGEQAKAFLDWKQEFHQKELSQLGLPFNVKYSLPTLDESKSNVISVKEIKTEPTNLTNWVISNADYLLFVAHVKDSIVRRILGEEFPDDFLIPVYDDELEEKDVEDWGINYTTKINSNPEFVKFLEEHPLKDEPLKQYIFEHYYYDFKHASVIGNFAQSDEEDYECPLKKQMRNTNSSPRGIPLCKDLRLGWTNSDCFNNDVRSHEDRSRFIIHEYISVYPGHISKWNPFCWWYENEGDDDYVNGDLYGNKVPCIDNSEEEINNYDFDSKPEEQITAITYDQFKAYWMWSIRSRNYPMKNENPLINNYIPSESEFELIQKGESVIHKEETHKLPTPGFRYCIRFYPK